MELSKFNDRLPDVSDMASVIEERERALSLQKIAKARQKEQDQKQIRDADGNVLCEDCGAVIPSGRLQVVPYAVQCVGCKSASEIIEKRFV